MNRVVDPANALAPDFRDCLAFLARRQVIFIIVGGYALGWHGFVRATGDLDLLYQCTEKNVERLCNALNDFGAPPQLIDPTFLRRPSAVTQIGVPPLRIDLLASISGVSFARALAGSIESHIDETLVRVIGLSELRRNKTATGRDKDKGDLRRLAEARKRALLESEDHDAN